jgi:S1-C subfamily serine protease
VSGGTTSPARRAATASIRVLEVLAIAGLVAGYVGLSQREDGVDREQRELAARARAVNARLDQIEASAGSEIEGLRTSLTVAGEAARAREGLLRQDLDRTTTAVGAQERKFDRISGLQEERIARSETDLGKRLETLAAQVAVEKRTNPAERFRNIQEAAEGSIFLLHCVFVYETKEFDDDWKQHEATTWGTAFSVSDDGLLVTNKHLVMPWKFDSELCALRAMGEVRVKEDSVKLAAWPAGCVCVDDKKKANMAGGYTSAKGTLALVSTAEDTFTEKTVEMSGKSIKYKMHALDNHDLALIRIADPTKPLRLAQGSTDTRLKKLDPVMAIGFPRGVGGLEATVAIPSATTGSVRKIEDTIHISAPIVAGNSGGPVFDEEGQVIGIATRIYSETLGICIKAEHARSLLDRGRAVESLAAVVPLK